MRKNNLHVCSLDKFIPRFYKLVDDSFGLENHFFWVAGDFKKYPMPADAAVYKVKSGFLYKIYAYFYLVIYMHKADKIILHGLFNKNVVRLLWAMPWLRGKCFWVLWGWDLYVKRNGKKNVRWRIAEFFRKPVIRGLGAITTTVPGDYELVKEWYGTKARFIHNLMYDSHVARESSVIERNDDVVNIQIGNSADPENNHAESLAAVKRCSEGKNIKVFCPLSYGNDAYAKEVIKLGREMFGDDFHPLVDFMDFDQYTRYLSKIDVAVFNHKRQQAMGNIIGLLSMGKTVYLRADETPFEYFKSIGVEVKEFSSLCSGVQLLSSVEKERNVEEIKKRFSKEKLVRSWSSIFSE